MLHLHRVFIVLFITISLVLLFPQFSFAACEDTGTDNIDQRIEDCKKRLQEVAGQKKTLSAALMYLNTQINFTKTKIAKTEQGLVQLKIDIDSLSNKIGQLNTSLDDVSTILVHRVRETYMRSRDEPLYLLLTDPSLQNFVNRYKYLKTIQNHDKEILLAMERIRSNYNVQKTDKQEKQEEMKNLNDQLLVQQSSLAKQQQEKQQLLEITSNDEKKYQQLLSEARVQLAAFKKFSIGQGGATTLSNQTTCGDWGCYYNQRDSSWGGMTLGNTEYTMADSGCFVTSVAMLASHYGKNIKPNDIAALSTAFTAVADLLHSFSVNGINVQLTAVSKDRLDDELDAGRSVIAGLHFARPDHFIVIKKKVDGGYIMNDPFLENGNDRPLTDKYKVSDITSLRLVSFN